MNGAAYLLLGFGTALCTYGLVAADLRFALAGWVGLLLRVDPDR